MPRSVSGRNHLVANALTNSREARVNVLSIDFPSYLTLSRYASRAGNYDLAMTAARHYWNTCQPLLSVPIERQLLKKPVKLILGYISDVAKDKGEEEVSFNVV